MIARTWHGRVSAVKADAYHEYLLRTGVGDYASTPGNRGVHVLRRVEGEVAHFLLITFWESWDAIKRFRVTTSGPGTTRRRTTSSSNGSPSSLTMKC